LLSAKPNYGDDCAFRLLGFFWTDAKQDQIEAAARGLVAQQRVEEPESRYRRALALQV
jgi:hypothetical protein